MSRSTDAEFLEAASTGQSHIAATRREQGEGEASPSRFLDDSDDGDDNAAFDSDSDVDAGDAFRELTRRRPRHHRGLRRPAAGAAARARTDASRAPRLRSTAFCEPVLLLARFRQHGRARRKPPR